MDYLDRDSLHAGVPYGRNFDRNRLIQSLLAQPGGRRAGHFQQGQDGRRADGLCPLRDVQRGVLAPRRPVGHEHVRPRVFRAAAPARSQRVFPRQRAGRDRGPAKRPPRERGASRLLAGIFGPKRGLYKRVAEFSLYQVPETYRLLGPPAVLRISWPVPRRWPSSFRPLWASRVGAVEILIDAPAAPPRNRIRRRDLLSRRRTSTGRLHQVSPVVDALARTQFDDYVKRVRIFAHPRLAGRIAARRQFSDLPCRRPSPKRRIEAGQLTPHDEPRTSATFSGPSCPI